MNDILQQDIQYLPGVGPSRKKMLNEELGINTYGSHYGDYSQYYLLHITNLHSVAKLHHFHIITKSLVD